MKNCLLVLSTLALFTFSGNSQDYKLKVYTEPYKKLTDATPYTPSEIWVDEFVEISEEFKYNGVLVESIEAYAGEVYFVFSDNTYTDFYTNLTQCKDLNYNNDTDNEGEPGSASTLSYKIVENNGNKILILESDSVGFYNEGEQQSGQYYSCQTWIYESGQVQVKVGKSKISDPIQDLFVLNAIVVTLDEDEEDATYYFIKDNPTSYELIKGITEPSESDYLFKRFPVENTVFEYYLDSPLSNTTVVSKPLSIQTLVTNNLQVSNVSETYVYTVFSITGETILSGNLSSNQIATNNLKAGSYIIQFRNEKGETQAFKFVKL